MFVQLGKFKGANIRKINIMSRQYHKIFRTIISDALETKRV